MFLANVNKKFYLHNQELLYLFWSDNIFYIIYDNILFPKIQWNKQTFILHIILQEVAQLDIKALSW